MTGIERSIKGETRRIPAGSKLADVMAELATAAAVVAAVNETFVPRSRHGEYVLADGDSVELLTPMEGG